jgi:hypothetical protein
MKSQQHVRTIEERYAAIDHTRVSMRDPDLSEEYLNGLLLAAEADRDTDQQYVILHHMLTLYCRCNKKRKAISVSKRILGIGSRSAIDSYYDAKSLVERFQAYRSATPHIEQGLDLLLREECSAHRLRTETRLFCLQLAVKLRTQQKPETVRRVLSHLMERTSLGAVLLEIPGLASEIVEADIMKSDMERRMLSQVLQMSWAELSRRSQFQDGDWAAEMVEYEDLIRRLDPVIPEP